MAERSQEPVERAVADTDDAIGAEHRVDLVLVGVDGAAKGMGGGVPEGVNDDVVDGVEWAEAVASDEEAAREGGPELRGGQPRDGVEVVAMDDVQ